MRRMTLCGVMSHNDTDGFDYIVVVGWRTSRRRLRVRAERLETTGHWRLTPRLPQQAIKVFAAIDRAQREVDCLGGPAA